MRFLQRRMLWVLPVIGALALTVSLTAHASTLMIGTTSLSGGTVGTAYSQTLTASGGTTPYTWSVSSGTLPAGLSLDASSGVISGTPTTVGTMTFTVRVMDNASDSAFQSLSIAVNAPTALSITTTGLPAGQLGVAYSQTLAATGGTAPYSWSITTGGLPAGLSLDASTGVISGTPTAVQTSAFTVQVMDHNSQTSSQALSITINSSSLAIVTTSLPGAMVGVAYAQAITASGGSAPYAWSVILGGLPAGLMLGASDGVISGTPTTAGMSTFTVLVTDDAGHTTAQVLSITVNASVVPPTSTPSGEEADEHGGEGNEAPGQQALCHALFQGSEEGMEHKQQSAAFQSLLQAASVAGVSVNVFCGMPVAAATATATATATAESHADDDHNGVQMQGAAQIEVSPGHIDMSNGHLNLSVGNGHMKMNQKHGDD